MDSKEWLIMFNRKVIVLADMNSSVLDVETGDRKTVVKDGKIFVAKFELVGIQTAQLGQVQGVDYDWSVEILKFHYYDNFEYLYADEKLYKIENVTKAKNPQNVLLQISAVTNSTILEAIQAWKESVESTELQA